MSSTPSIPFTPSIPSTVHGQGPGATPLLAFRGVSKSFSLPTGEQFPVLRDVHLDVGRARKLAIIGRSGSGKSTLLHLAAGIEVPTSGEILLDGRALSSMTERDRTLMRRHHCGLIFQFFHLVPHLSVADNVSLPSLIAGEKPAEFRPRADELLNRVGLLSRSRDIAQKLSGGEMQRVALCRALMRRPRLLLADEPTGSLDDATGRLVMDLLLQLTREEGATLVYVTHSLELASLADEIWRIHSGVLEPA